MFVLYYEKGFTKILIQKSYDKNYLEKRAELLRKGVNIGDGISCLCCLMATSLMSVIGNYIVEPFKEQ